MPPSIELPSLNADKATNPTGPDRDQGEREGEDGHPEAGKEVVQGVAANAPDEAQTPSPDRNSNYITGWRLYVLMFGFVCPGPIYVLGLALTVMSQLALGPVSRGVGDNNRQHISRLHIQRPRRLRPAELDRHVLSSDIHGSDDEVPTRLKRSEADIVVQDSSSSTPNSAMSWAGRSLFSSPRPSSQLPLLHAALPTP